MRRRRRDLWQLWLIGMSLIFLSVGLLAQTQDYINGANAQRLDALDLRLSRLETYAFALASAVIGNLIAHIVEIRGRHKDRQL